MTAAPFLQRREGAGELPPLPLSTGNLAESVLAHLDHGLLVLDAQTDRFSFVNDAAARLLGFSDATELLKSPPSEVMSRFELRDESGRLLSHEALPSRRALQTRSIVETTLRFSLLSTGEERSSWVRAVPLTDGAGQVHSVACFFHDITRPATSERALRVLATASSLLAGSSLDLEATLSAVAQAAVPQLSDWCAVELLEDDGTSRQVAVAHVDPEKVRYAHELRQKYPPDPTLPRGVPHVLRTGQVDFVPEISDELLRATSRDEEQYRIAKALGLRSYVVVPLVARDRVLGALTLVSAESGRRFSAADVELAQLLAVRAALAVDNARLYAQSRRSHERLEMALAAGRLGAWEWDIPGGKVSWSPVLERIHGIPEGSFDGTFEMYQSDMHPEDKPRVLASIQSLLQERRRHHFLDYRIIRPDGEVRWLEATGELSLDANGNPHRLTGVCKDVTERRQGEELARKLALEQAARTAAERLEERTRAILESISDPFFLMQPDGTVTYANGRAGSFFEAPELPLVGRNVWELAAQNPLDTFRSEAEQALASGTPRAAEFQRGERIYETFLHPSSLGLSVYCREITLRRQAERELSRQTEELRRSNSELEQFAYVASHDLQEPLRMVASYTQLLARRYKGKLDDDADEFIQYAVDGVTRMQGLIQDLLTYSRVGTRGRTLVPIRIGRVVELAQDNLQLAIQEAGASLTQDPLPEVKGDESQLVQLFQNLIGNALKFRGKAPPRIHISAERRGAQWELRVKDNGIGISPQYFERVFIIFQRLHLRNEYPGNGIGLAICRKIVERHNGRIWLSSQPGEGTTVHFTLPAVDAETEQT